MKSAKLFTLKKLRLYDISTPLFMNHITYMLPMCHRNPNARGMATKPLTISGRALLSPGTHSEPSLNYSFDQLLHYIGNLV